MIPSRFSTLITLTLATMITACAGEVQKKEVKIRHFGRYQSVFNDNNEEHLVSAKKHGVPQVKSREDAENLDLEEIETGDLYKVNTLTHSIPYLVPRAKDLLDQIGENFQDSLDAQGVGGYQICVTSVLRSVEDVAKLRRVNVNASSNSAHCYGTTFDISWATFNKIESDYPYEVPEQHLKHLLAEVLIDLMKEDECYVKYEVRQGCFHITTR